MLRVLHLSVSMNPSIGFIKQLEAEVAAADEIGVPWKSEVLTPKAINSPIVARYATGGGRFTTYVALRANYRTWVEERISGCDVLLLRYSVHDPWQASLIRTVRKPVYTVHHTLEPREIRVVGGLLGRVGALAEHIVGAVSLRSVRGIIGVTKQIVEFERKRSSGVVPIERCLVYPNGIDISRYKVSDIITNDCIKDVVFVANRFEPWHGLDLLAKAAERSRAKLRIHIVGSAGPDIQRRLLSDKRFVLHGFLGERDLAELYRTARVGISSLGLDRNGLNEACPLKAREYLANGLAVYGDYADSGLPPEFPYYRRGGADLDEIAAFSRYVMQSSKRDIASASRRWISKSEIMRRFYINLTRAENSEI